MNAELEQYINEKQALINSELNRLILDLPIDTQLKESMLYSIKAGGKRLRPILLIAAYEALGGKEREILTVGCALEMIHTYSLIHDDLPAMDDDDFRRGLPTNHKQFGEATAILAGDALLTYSFEVLAKEQAIPAELRVELIGLLAEASGPQGMVWGQQLDMEAEDKTTPLSELENIHSLKTGKLLEFSVVAGAKLSRASALQVASLKTFSRLLGIIFQVQDDILDISGNPEKMGKPLGSDKANMKSTYPGLLGLEGAIQKKKEYTEAAKKALSEAGINQSILILIVDYFASRDH